jgi:hypothetical protein
MLEHPDSKRIIGTTKIFEIWGFHGGEDDNGVLDFISVWTSVLKMKTRCFTETLAATYEFTRCQTQKNISCNVISV